MISTGLARHKKCDSSDSRTSLGKWKTRKKKGGKYRGFFRFSFLRRLSILIGSATSSVVYQVLNCHASERIGSNCQKSKLRTQFSKLELHLKMRVNRPHFFILNPRSFNQRRMRLVSRKDRLRIEATLS